MLAKHKGNIRNTFKHDLLKLLVCVLEGPKNNANQPSKQNITPLYKFVSPRSCA